MSYRPLPLGLTVSKSTIEGLGLFATQPLPENTVLGIIHVKDARFENDCIRTPLGGFINHSQDPNLQSFLKNDFNNLNLHIFDLFHE